MLLANLGGWPEGQPHRESDTELEKISLKAKHKPKAKMRGKIVLVDDAYAFYHAHKRSQPRHLLDELTIGVSVGDRLRSRGIGTVNYYDVEQRILGVASARDFLEIGSRQTWDARDRYYLRLKPWEQSEHWYQEPRWAPFAVALGEQERVWALWCFSRAEDEPWTALLCNAGAEPSQQEEERYGVSRLTVRMTEMLPQGNAL